MNDSYDQLPSESGELFSDIQAAELQQNGFAITGTGELTPEAAIPQLAQALAASQGKTADEFQPVSLRPHAIDGFLPATTGTDTAAFIITGGQGTASLICGRHSTQAPIQPGSVILVRGVDERSRSYKDQTWIKFEGAGEEPLSAVALTSREEKDTAYTQQNELLSAGALGRSAETANVARQSAIMERRFNRRMHRLGGAILRRFR